MTFRGTIVVSAAAIILSLAVLIGASFFSDAIQSRYLARAEMAHRQALLVTRLEADIVARSLTSPAQRAALDGVIRSGLHDYLATIRSESNLIDDDPDSAVHQSREWRDGLRLAAIITDGSDGTAWIDARLLSHQIAVRERDEAQEAAASITTVRQTLRMITWGIAALLLVLYGLVATLLWRGVIKPVAGLIEGTSKVASEQSRVRVPPTGLRELQDLAEHFNGMANAIEYRVARRTQALERANSKLHDVDRNRRMFFSKVSHELRTPVTVIRGEAEVALRHPRDREGLCESMAHILDNSAFLQRRLDDLLALACAEDGALSLTRDPLDLIDVLREAHDMVAPFARANGVCLELGYSAANVGLVGDRERLRQALVAIIDNGIKFSPPGGVIALRLRAQGHTAHIAILDDGPGIPEDELCSIFDPYVQTAAGRSRGGTGIGLSLARWVSSQHGGTIAAANRDGGKGLQVSLTLPMAA